MRKLWAKNALCTAEITGILTILCIYILRGQQKGGRQTLQQALCPSFLTR